MESNGGIKCVCFCEVLENVITEMGLRAEDYWWYGHLHISIR